MPRREGKRRSYTYTGAAATGETLSANDALVGIAWAALRRVRERGAEAPPRLRWAKEHFAYQTVDLRRYCTLPAETLDGRVCS